MGCIEVRGVTLQVERQAEQCFTDRVNESDVPQSRVMEVSWSHSDLKKETLKMYLENRKRSGGGQVQDLQFFAKDRKAYVVFVDAECKLLY